MPDRSVPVRTRTVTFFTKELSCFCISSISVAIKLSSVDLATTFDASFCKIESLVVNLSKRSSSIIFLTVARRDIPATVPSLSDNPKNRFDVKRRTVLTSGNTTIRLSNSPICKGEMI